jgi:hypothetical protein
MGIENINVFPFVLSLSKHNERFAVPHSAGGV